MMVKNRNKEFRKGVIDMYYNTIRLLKGERQYQCKTFEENFTKGDTIFGDNCEPIELVRWNIEDKNAAEAALARYNCEYDYGGLQRTYYVTEYALEYCDCDEDGDFISGSDYDLATGGLTQKAFIHLACNGRGVENDNVNVWVEVNGVQYKINHENMEIDETEVSELSCYLEDNHDHEIWDMLYGEYLESLK